MKILKGILFLLVSTSALAIDPSHNWQTLQTPNFEIHFAQGDETLAYKAAAVAERVHGRLSSRLNWQPLEKTHLVISDETDQPNGYAIPFPFNRSVLFMAPPDSTNTLEDFDDWLELLITHEYTHVLHLDKASGGAGMLRNLFGRHFLLFPNLFQPGWLTEGLATHYETNSAQGIGRGQSSYFAMMMRMEVAAGIKPVSQVNLPVRTWPMGTSYYLYGVFFYDFLAELYGEDTINALIANYSNNIIPFMINSNSQSILGKDITELWAEYELWLQNKYLPQIKHIEQHGVISGEPLTADGYFTSQIRMAANGYLFYIRDGAYDHSMLMMIDDKGVHHAMAEVHHGARIDVNAHNAALVAQPEICDEYNIYYDLYLLESGSDTLRRLTHCERYRSAAWVDESTVIAVHIEQAVSSLHKINLVTGKREILWQGDASTIVGQPDVSDDGKTLAASVFRKGQGWNIELFDIENHNWTMLTRDPVIDMNPRFSGDGSALLFSSERNAVYNIYRYDLAEKTISALTHVIGGAFQPAQHDSLSPLYYTGYGAGGTDIFQISNPSPLTREPLPELSSSAIPADEPVYAALPATDYSPWSSLQPRWWFPIVLLTEDQSEAGFTTSGNDALGLHNYAFSFAWDATNDWATGSFVYAWSNRFAFGLERATDILLDSNDDFAVARHNDDAFVLLNFPYTRLDTQWNLALAAIGTRHSDGRRAPLIAPLPDMQDNLLGMALGFNNSHHYIRSVSANDGRTVHVIAESSDVFSSDYSGEVYTLDWREYLPLGGQHVLALRLLAGYGTDQPEPFQLGGESSDFSLLDLLNGASTALFGKRDYALRGYAEGHAELRGRRMQLASAEWRFPLSLVERGYMAPPVGLMQLSGSVFADSGLAWQDNKGDAYNSMGAELHGDINLFYGINVKLRLGYARGLDELIGDDRLYLSLGAAF